MTGLFGTGLSLFGFRLVFGEQDVLLSVDPFGQLSFFGDNRSLGPVGWWLLYRTRFGLAVRTVGENPEAADAAGGNVFHIRYLALLIGGAVCVYRRRGLICRLNSFWRCPIW